MREKSKKRFDVRESHVSKETMIACATIVQLTMSKERIYIPVNICFNFAPFLSSVVLLGVFAPLMIASLTSSNEVVLGSLD